MNTVRRRLLASILALPALMSASIAPSRKQDEVYDVHVVSYHKATIISSDLKPQVSLVRGFFYLYITDTRGREIVAGIYNKQPTIVHDRLHQLKDIWLHPNHISLLPNGCIKLQRPGLEVDLIYPVSQYER